MDTHAGPYFAMALLSALLLYLGTKAKASILIRSLSLIVSHVPSCELNMNTSVFTIIRPNQTQAYFKYPIQTCTDI